jgi:hypothetical protein
MQEADGTMRPMTDEEVKDAGGHEVLRRTPPQKVLAVGMKFRINGAWFVVRKITKKDVFLRGIPEPMPMHAKAKKEETTC